MVTKRYIIKLFTGNKMKADMNNILTVLVRWLNNYFTISEEEMNELEFVSKIAINKANINSDILIISTLEGGIIACTL